LCEATGEEACQVCYTPGVKKIFLIVLALLLADTLYPLVKDYTNSTRTDEPAPVVLEENAALSIESDKLENQLGQLFMIGHWANTPAASTTQLIAQYQLGGVIIMSTPKDPQEIKDWVKEWNAVSKTSLFIAIDQEGGPVSRLKTADFIQTGQSSITTTDQAYAVGLERGQQLSELGINMNFAPVLDTADSPDSFMHQRVFPSETDAPTLAQAMISGMAQSAVVGAIKHFPGHDDTNTDSHYALPVVPITLLELDAFTADFRNVITNSQPKMLMTAHVQFPNIDPYPATLSRFFLTDYLKDTLGYQGLIITDDMTMDAIDTYYDTTEASQLAIEAGAHMILFAAEPEKIHEAFPFILKKSETLGTLQNQIIKSYQQITTLKQISQ
jgi:beta-N-acetylhexosaminidase